MNRDKHSGYAEITHGKLSAWNQAPGEPWRIVESNSVVAEAIMRKETFRRDDFTGQKAYRQITRWHVTVSVRIGWTGNRITLPEMTFDGGEVATLKALLKMWEQGLFERDALWEARRVTREAGISEIARMDAEYFYGWHTLEDDRERVRRATQNLLGLIEKEKEDGSD